LVVGSKCCEGSHKDNGDKTGGGHTLQSTSLSYEKEVTTRSCVEQDLIVFCLTISLSLVSLESSLNLPRCLEDLFRPFFFEFSHLLGLLNDFPRLAFRELLGLSPKTFNIVTSAVTLPIFEVSIAISLALDTSTADLVALIGQVSIDSKLG
jgi:hypothetical protein